MKTVIGYVGKLGSGKNYCAMKQVDELKDTGNTIYLISFADPIKQILRNSFGLTKAGKIVVKLPQINELYVKQQIVDTMWNLIKDLNYEKFDISESDAKAYIARNYEKYEAKFYDAVVTATETAVQREYNQSFRTLGQMLGTELGRYLVDTIWVDIAFNKIKKVFKYDLADYAYVMDVRFVNEYKLLEEFREKTAFDSKVFGIVASDETRAIRRGLSIEDLKAQDEHGSEKEIDTIISLLPESSLIHND